MSIKNTLKKAAGLFVEFEEKPRTLGDITFADFEAEGAAKAKANPMPMPDPAPAPAPKTVEQVVKESPGPNLDEIKVEPAKVEISAPGGAINFADVYAKAQIPASQFGAEQAVEMIGQLPNELPIEVRRQTVQVTMNSMGKATGVTAESVVADASRKLAALDAYSDALAAKTQDFIAMTTLQITKLENEIAEKRRIIDDTKRLLETANEAIVKEADKLDDVLEFFTLDVAPSKLAP